MTDLGELLERVKAATGPDREIDGRLWCMITPNRKFIGMATDGQRWGDFDPNGFNPASGVIAGMVFERTDFKGTREDIQKNGGRLQSFPSSPAYTASVDAALAIVERALPGWRYDLHSPRMGQTWEAVLMDGDSASRRIVVGHAATALLAILTALLLALEAQNGK